MGDQREESALNMFRQMDLKGKVKDDTQLKTVHQNTISTIRAYEQTGGVIKKFSSKSSAKHIGCHGYQLTLFSQRCGWTSSYMVCIETSTSIYPLCSWQSSSRSRYKSIEDLHIPLLEPIYGNDFKAYIVSSPSPTQMWRHAAETDVYRFAGSSETNSFVPHVSRTCEFWFSTF